MHRQKKISSVLLKNQREDLKHERKEKNKLRIVKKPKGRLKIGRFAIKKVSYY